MPCWSITAGGTLACLALARIHRGANDAAASEVVVVPGDDGDIDDDVDIDNNDNKVKLALTSLLAFVCYQVGRRRPLAARCKMYDTHFSGQLSLCESAELSSLSSQPGVGSDPLIVIGDAPVSFDEQVGFLTAPKISWSPIRDASLSPSNGFAPVNLFMQRVNNSLLVVG